MEEETERLLDETSLFSCFKQVRLDLEFALGNNIWETVKQDKN